MKKTMNKLYRVNVTKNVSYIIIQMLEQVCNVMMMKLFLIMLAIKNVQLVLKMQKFFVWKINILKEKLSYIIFNK